jgi:hypothetical protein
MATITELRCASAFRSLGMVDAGFMAACERYGSQAYEVKGQRGKP